MIIDHVLLTRFNLPSAGVESLVRAKEGWLRDRQALFERYCLPSVASQSNKNFHWVIYFDTQSPQWLKDRIAELSAGGLFTPIFRDEVPHDVLVADLRRVTGARGQIILTTNLDNDDGLAEDFVERLQQSVRNQEQTALYIVHGLIQQDGRVYLRRDPVNAFCSVKESWRSPDTCWSEWHTKLGEKMAVQEILDGPGWLQVIHTGNVSNRVHGRRVSPSKYSSVFSAGLVASEEPRSWELLCDRWLLAPVRAGRGTVRGAGKTLILRIGGKGALDNVKAILAGMRPREVQRKRF